MLRSPVLALSIAAGLLTQAMAAHADPAGDCFGYGALKDNPDLAIARLGPAPRTFFVKGSSDSKGCPDATDACRDKAFLVPGDQVIAGENHQAFTCVDFIGPKSTDRAGWLPSASLAREQATPVEQKDWLGTWVTVEAKVTIKPGAAGRLKIQGDATFGMLEPDRVRRGAVNVGEVQGDIAPQGPNLAFDMAQDKTLPVDKGDEADCKVWMRRLGRYLLVDDNRNCGGMNVSFAGAYLRKP